MTDGPGNPDANAFIEKIGAVEHQVAEYSSFLKKLKMRLTRTKKALASKPAVASQVTALVTDLHAMKTEPGRPVISQLIESLDGQLHTLQRRTRESFPSDLRQSCESAKLDFKALQDGFGVGPFLVTVDVQKETASFQYARVLVVKDVPLNVQAIVAQATSLKATLLDSPVDFPKFQSQLCEAMRVAVARRENRLPTGELRADLPAVFREMCIIRQPASATTKRTLGDYPLPRFVVELKQFLQSDQNIHAGPQFRLEPAVIENTKNPKKSIFIPREITCGFGEGTYTQAIVLQQP